MLSGFKFPILAYPMLLHAPRIDSFTAVLNPGHLGDQQPESHCRPLQSFKKLVSSRFPCSVMIDSGWNCTPSIGYCLCRRPIIRPSDVVADTSRQSGQDSFSTISEWYLVALKRYGKP